MPLAPIAVEILHTPGWGRWEAARDAVLRAAAEEGVAIRVVTTRVDTLEHAVALRFPGSPTVRVEGGDIDPPASASVDFGLG